jgi:hypothetical protein
MSTYCPVDGALHKQDQRCGRCGHGLHNAVVGPKQLFTHCPYDKGGLVVKELLDYAGMARFVCTTPHCLFELTQGTSE